MAEKLNQVLWQGTDKEDNVNASISPPNDAIIWTILLSQPAISYQFRLWPRQVEHKGPFHVQILISANLGLNLHRVSPSFVQKHFLRKFSPLVRDSSQQIADKEN